MTIFNSVTKPLGAIVLALSLSACGGSGSGGNTGGGGNTVNVAPAVDAGAVQSVNENTQVTLIGSASDSDGTIASFSWTQVDGPSVELLDASNATTSFMAPEVSQDATLRFQLTATDNQGATASALVDVTVINVNQLPTVNAGDDQTYREGNEVMLTGSASDSDGSIVSYQWQQTAGIAVTLQDANSATARFSIPAITEDSSFEFQLTVTDNDGGSATDSISITAINERPVSELNIVDANLRHCVDTAIANAGYVHISDIKVMTCALVNVTNLAGIEDLTALEYLDLNSNVYQGSLEYLSSLTALDTLILSGNLITDISPLANLSNLRRLDLGSRGVLLGLVKNQVADITVLKDLDKLEEVLIADNLVKDLTPLVNLPQLKTLDLTRNPIGDSTVIAQLTGLTDLVFNYATAIDHMHLAPLVNLRRLKMQRAEMTDVSFMAAMTQLTTLDLSYNALSDISPLAGLIKLTSANFNSNQLVDISALAGATELQNLKLALNNIDEVTALAGMTGMQSLDLQSNQLTDLTPLFGFTSLTHLNIWRNNQLPCVMIQQAINLFGEDVVNAPDTCQTSDDLPLSDIEFSDSNLKACVLQTAAANDWTYVAQMTSLTCKGQQLDDLTGLDKLSHLRAVDLSDNQIKSTYQLRELTGLTDLNLANNYLGRTEYLTSLTNLTTLNLSDNYAIHCDDLATLQSTLGEGVVTTTIPCYQPQLITQMQFADSRLKTCVLTMANQYELTTSDEVTYLYCAAMGITNLADIEQLPYVNSALFYENEISSLAPLTAIKGLRNLGISHNQVTDISPLAALKLVKEVDFSYNQISHLVANDGHEIWDMSHLDSLNLSGNPLSSTQSFAQVNLSGLTVLNLYGLQLTDIGELAGLTSMETLTIAHNQITDISVLATMPALKDLSAYNNLIGDISPLVNLTQLRSAYLYNNQLTSFAAFAQLPLMAYVDLRNNHIVSSDEYMGLDFSHIKQLTLTDNRLTDVDFIAQGNWDSLEILHVNNNQISDVTGLADAQGVKTIWLHNNQLTDIVPLHNLPQIYRLNLYDNNGIACWQLDVFEVAENYPNLYEWGRPASCVE